MGDEERQQLVRSHNGSFFIPLKIASAVFFYALKEVRLNGNAKT